MNCLLRRRTMMRNEEKRTYLYHEGDTCDEITGGWEVIKNAFMRSDYIQLLHDPNTKKIRTVNPITFKKIFIDVERTEPFDSMVYSFRVYVGDKEIVSESIEMNKRIVIEKEFKSDVTGILCIGAYFGNYKIYNIWIE